jgi:hypothetical protein
MNIQFDFKNESYDGKDMVFHSTNFPENIHFKKGDFISISDFDKFLVKGNLYYDFDQDYAEIGDKDSLCEILNFHHVFDEKIGYILIVIIKSL